jgi:mercuric ion transport protein
VCSHVRAARRLIAAVVGTAVAACCFTPILLIVLAAIGLSALTKYLDHVLIPALLMMIFMTWSPRRGWANWVIYWML